MSVILAIAFLLFAATVIALVLRGLSPSISKDKHPGLAYKTYLLATILIGQVMISAEILNYEDFAALMMPVVVLFWPLVSASVSLMVDRRWFALPAAYSILAWWPVLSCLVTGSLMPTHHYWIMLGTLMTIGAVLTLVLTKLRRH